MSENHGRAGRYRDDLESRPVAKVCAYEFMIPAWGPCGGGELQAEHTVELADSPWQKADTAYLLWACPNHNRAKADEARRRRQARKGGPVAETAPRSTRTATGAGKGKTPRGATAVAQVHATSGGMSLPTRLTLGGLLIAAACVMFFDLTDNIARWVADWWWCALILAATGGALVAWWQLRARSARERAAERALGLEAFRASVARALGAAPGAVTIAPRGRRAWDGHVLTSARIRYPGAILHDDPRIIEEASKTLRSAIGPAVRIVTWDRFGNFIDYERGGTPVAQRASAPAEIEAPAPEAERHEAIRANLTDSLQQQFKDQSIRVTVVETAVDASPTALRVFYGQKFPDARDTARADLLAAVASKTGERWRPQWQPPINVVLLARRPKMPSFVPNPMPDLWEASEPHRFPIGVDEHGAIVWWDIYDAAHALMAGGTGAGKSVILQALVWWASVQGWEIVLIDPKGTGLGGLRKLPGVVVAALADPEVMALALEESDAEMRRRYGLVLEGLVSDYRAFPRRLVVADEVAELVGLITRWWAATREKTDPRVHASLEAIASIPRLGRECNVLEVIGIQQAAAGFFDGTEARDNYGFRLGAGPQSLQAAQMLFGRGDVGRDVPQSAKGRATYALKQGEATEMQAFWTPTLLPNGSVKPRSDKDAGPHPDDVALIERMWEAVRRAAAKREKARASTAAGPLAEAPTEPVQRPTLTVVQPRPRARAKDAKPPVPVGFLRTCLRNGTPARVIVDGEAVHVDGVEPDETTPEYVQLHLRDGKGETRWVSFPDNEMFELAADEG